MNAFDWLLAGFIAACCFAAAYTLYRFYYPS